MLTYSCLVVHKEPQVADESIYRDMAGTPYYIAPEVLEQSFNRTGKVCPKPINSYEIFFFECVCVCVCVCVYVCCVRV